MRPIPNLAATAAATARRLDGVIADGAEPGRGPCLNLQPCEAPALRPAGKRCDPVGHPGVDQRLRADDAPGASGAGYHDQGFGQVDEVAEAMDQFGARAGDRSRDVKAGIFLDRPAVEHDDPLSRAPQTVQLRGRDRRDGVLVLDNFGEGFARDITAREQPIARRRPGRRTAGQFLKVGVAELGKAARCLGRDAIRIIQKDDPA